MHRRPLQIATDVVVDAPLLDGKTTLTCTEQLVRTRAPFATV